MPSDTRTLREIHEGVVKRHTWHVANNRDRCKWCGKDWICPDYRDAVAALDLLNNAEREWIAGTSPIAPNHYTNNRLIPDLERKP